MGGELHGQNLDSLEQERYNIRRRLERVQEECDSKVTELQGDVSELKKTLDFRESLHKQIEKDKCQLIDELTAQNQRLKDQLRESGKVEENLTNQLSSLRDQCMLKKSSLQDHVSSLEILRDEVQFLTDKKRDLEARLGQTCEERDALTAALEESVERVRLLERHTREQDSQIRSTTRELERVRAANTTLGEQLDAMHSLESPQQRSLLNEMECDDGFHSSAYSSLEKEIIACCETLRNMCNYLKSRNSVGSEQSSDQSMLSDLNISNVKVGILTSIVEELESLINVNDSRNSGLDPEMETRMEIDMHRTKEALERADKELAEKNEELKARAELIIDLTAKLTVKETELKTALEEKEIAKSDLHKADGNQDEIVKEAREARDAAITRKGELELQLARVRIEVLQANSQLMEAVQQKVELSQQLEQWQVDMQCLLDEQMKAKLTKQERKREAVMNNQNANASGPRRILSLFR
ncbi:hypothetical protein RUM44_007624 [Polyplax serrata]|uniref:Uncharacterized protein n=1 Tax=Polyplax serrata TaxID=468196 RepID=A0ABR1BAH0_POLSC